MRPPLLAALLKDPEYLAKRILRLKELLPDANISSMAAKEPGLLLKVGWGIGLVLTAALLCCIHLIPRFGWDCHNLEAPVTAMTASSVSPPSGCQLALRLPHFGASRSCHAAAGKAERLMRLRFIDQRFHSSAGLLCRTLRSWHSR